MRVRGAAERERSPWFALAALCLGFFLMLLDSTIVAVAIPVIATALDETAGSTVWVNLSLIHKSEPTRQQL